MLLRMQITCLVCAVALSAFAQEVPPPTKDQVDMSEVYRRGDSVTVMGEGPRSAESEAFAHAMAPPEDDSHMWFISVWSKKNCEYCEKLKQDFQHAPELLAFVSAPEQTKAWAHYNVFNGEDQTQKFRREAYKVTAYPTIAIQPPRNGMWGDPRTIVFYQVGYRGDPRELQAAIVKAVRTYAAIKAKEGYPKDPKTTPRAQAPVQQFSSPGVAEPAGDSEPDEPQSPPEEPVKEEPVNDQGPATAYVHATTAVYTTTKPVQLAQNPPFQTPPAPDPFNPNPTPSVYPNNNPNNNPQTYPPMDPERNRNPLDGVPMYQYPSIGGLIWALLTSSGLTNFLLVMCIAVVSVLAALGKFSTNPSRSATTRRNNNKTTAG